MMISKGVYYIGVSDSNIRTFDIIMKTANGTTYNAYLIKTTDGVIILDTVKEEFSEAFFEKIEAICSYDEIKYIVMHHLEPDHSGALPMLVKKAPQAKIFISPMATSMLKSITKIDNMEFETVWTNKLLKLGDKTLKFLSTPNLHWPETMSSYLLEDKILFSGDVFGSHYYDNRIFDDLVGDFDYAFKYYYDHIMRPFKGDVLNALRLYDKLDIETIAPLHGPIMRLNPQKYLSLYKEWSQKSLKRNGKKVVSIFYVTSYKNTQEMAQKIYEGVEKHSDTLIANIYDLTALDEHNMLNILEESTGIIIGTPTINGDAPKPVWELLSCMMLLEKRGKFGASFGSFGWSGEAPEMIQQRMKSLNFRVPLLALKVKLIPTQDELELCYNFGNEFGEIVNGKMIEMTL
ncbi:MAG: lactamase [Sulfurovum sp. AS07-7]|nr:MAG: lactamase [Sulfurovum sp. AS07-7]